MLKYCAWDLGQIVNWLFLVNNLSFVFEIFPLIQIVRELQKVLNTEDVACIIDAKHLCVNSRGIRDIESSTVTAEFGGKFKDEAIKREFLDYIKLDTKF